MRSPSEIVLKTFLSRASAEKQERLLRFLPEAEQLRLKELPPLEKEQKEPFTTSSLLEHVHWSWFIPTLKSYSEIEQKRFLAALSPVAAQSLAQELSLSPPFSEITRTGRNYLREILEKSLASEETQLLPLEYLPPSPLNFLLRSSKKELVHLADLLSMYDLSTELRQIVETKILKKLYSFLSEEERKALKHAGTHKDPFPAARLNLERWDGTEESLRLLLHRRGLARLGAALSRQDRSLIWYIAHQLDIGRGTSLFQAASKEVAPPVAEAMIRQIEELSRGS